MNRLCLVLLFAVVLQGCGSMMVGAPASSGAPEREKDLRSSVQDDGITAEVKSELRRDSQLRSLPIWVETNNAIVTLSGSVGSYEARDRAGYIASRVRNVEAVDNRLSIGTGSGHF
ncbi:MAG: BON domain-containing protein [Gammaproteobacteria bacterium]|nr:BON domain-containing protein [Gammaproteobacteria bacterium]